MKTIIKLIIITIFLITPLQVFANSTVLKNFNAPKSTVQKNLPAKNTKSVNNNRQIIKTAPNQQTNQTSCLVQFPAESLSVPVGYIYNDAAAKINSIDPSVATSLTTYFPGLRGTNQLVIYTPQYGLKTGTNEFGTEAIVIGNTVTQLNGADSIIPRNGFVISGHGTAKKWINQNISVGSKIYVDTENKRIRTFLTPDSFIFAAKEKIKEANSLMEYYREIDILYNDKKAVDYINKAKDLLRKAERNQDKAQIYISEAMDNANLAIQYAIPYKANEIKGIWIRPTETTKEDIVKTINHLQSVGINNVFLETYFHGKTIYPSEVLNNYKVTNQREEFVGIDPLRIWIDECHKRNMKLHVWFETFYVGNQNPAGNPKHVLTVYPSWANTTKAGYASDTPVASLSEHNGYFIDPANPEVQRYLLAILREIIVKYRPDGINLDYIRYPQSIAAKFSNYDMTNWGYTEYARNEFRSNYQLDPLEIKYSSDGWNLWAKYRQNKITYFVEQTRILTKPNNIMLTTVIFPDRLKCLETKMQDWKTWSVRNLVDGFTPLILTSDKVTASSLIKDIKNNTSPNISIFPGLFVTFMGGAFDDLLMQIQECRKLQAGGIVLFDYAHLDAKYINALQARVFIADSTYSTEKKPIVKVTQPVSAPQSKTKTKKRRSIWFSFD